MMCYVSVILDSEKLHLSDFENSQAHELTTGAGKFRVLWQLYRIKLGNTIELTTGALLTPYCTASFLKHL
jgi:hypothetical protein